MVNKACGVEINFWGTSLALNVFISKVASEDCVSAKTEVWFPGRLKLLHERFGRAKMVGRGENS